MALLVLLPLSYGEIAWLNQIMASGYHDELINAVESAVFGAPATELAGRFPHTIVSEALHVSYLAFYPSIYVPPLLLWRADRRDALRVTVLGTVLAAGLCYAVFVYFPVQGPRYFGPPEGVPDGPFRALTLRILEAGSSQGAAFPSSHMSIMLSIALIQWRLQPRLGRVLMVFAAGLAVGAVYGGFHYATDMAVGALVGVGAAWFALRSFRGDEPDEAAA
jgi:membrane-associated phospholipid phosphatase